MLKGLYVRRELGSGHPEGIGGYQWGMPGIMSRAPVQLVARGSSGGSRRELRVRQEERERDGRGRRRRLAVGGPGSE